MNKKLVILYAAITCILMPYKALAQLDITVHPGHYTSDMDNEISQQLLINDIPGNASLVDNSQWINQRAETMKDITDYIPGVTVQPHDGAESSRLSIRGSGLANTFQSRGLLVLQDGIPINTADGEFEFPVVEPWLIKYAEVFPGADALQYGSSNFGGAINFITANGITDNGIGLQAEGGSFGTFHALTSVGKQWNGGDIYAAATGFTQDGYRRQNQQDTSHIDLNIGLQLTSSLTNRIYINHTTTDAEIPGAISLAQIKIDPTQANPANAAGDYQRNLDITRIADKTAWQDGDNSIDTTVYYTYRTLDNPVTTYEFQNNNDVGMLASYTHQYGQSKFLIGTNNYYGTADEVRYQNIAGNPGAHILSRDLYAQTSEAYGQVEQHLVGNLFGIMGAQGSYAMRNIDQSYPTNTHQDEYYSGFSPKIGLRYDITQENQIFANLSRSFEPPTWSELSGGNNPGFNQLSAQTATTAEIGARGILNNFHVEGAYYHGWLKNEFVNYLFPDGDTATINAARTKRDGIELGINGDIDKNIFVADDAVSMRAAYTYSHFTLDNDALYGNNTLPGVPQHYVRGEVLYRHPLGFGIGPNVEWSPKAAPVDLTNSLYAGSYAIYGMRAFWESVNKKYNFYVEGRNLFNRDYIATYNVVPDAAGQDGRYFYPGEGRAVYIGFGLRL